MTKKEAIQVLAILKAAYPNSYKGLTPDEANATCMIWATQFANVPVDIVMISINKLISTNTFPPSISEVKENIRGLYWEAYTIIATKNIRLTHEQREFYNRIIEVTSPMQTRDEPSLIDLFPMYNTKQIEG